MKFSTSIFRPLVVTFCVLFFYACNPNSESGNSKNSISPADYVIPKPQAISAQKSDGFSFKNTVTISAEENLNSEKKYLYNLLVNDYQISAEISPEFSGEKENSSSIYLQVSSELDSLTHKITCFNNELKITGGSPESVFNGIQTVRQLMSINTVGTELPVLRSFELSDSPKFKWRGMLLDVCRHYFPKDVVLDYIDLLAFYKMNVLHFHITEDQAWRIAIDAYPKLTGVGAFREDLLDKDGEPYGGFYTKDDIREIVKYASERHIQVVPEIEMPGHSSAALAAYPELSCNGEQISVPNDWGVFKDIYCPTEYTFEFLETVLGEVMELFPSNYVHIGGDEAPKTRWEESEYCTELMKKEGLSDYEELQSYFINRMAKYLQENGKTIIGWDEILNDELTETAIIQSWRGMDGGKKAVSEGRQAIMSPTSHCYLDYSLKAIDTEKIYGFDPIPPDCNAEEAARILGAECNMWTEHVPDRETLDSKVFPRLIAASEAFWGTNTDYDSFLSRLDGHYAYLDKRGVTYGSETVAISIVTKTDEKGISVHLTENLRNPETIYTIHSGAIASDTVYFKGEIITAPKNTTSQLKIASGVKSAGHKEEILMSFNHHDWLTASTSYSVPYSDYYTAGGENGLTDGVLGSLDFRDGHWQGFFGDDVDLIIENPNENKEISSVSMNFYRYINSWIFPPESVAIFISKDGVNFTQLDRFSYTDNEMHKRGKGILSPSFTFDSVEANYLKVSIKNIGEVPYWHEASSEPAWVFVDEVVVN